MLKLNMKELVPLVTEVIESGATFRLYPRGESMLPTLCPGDDSVDLAKPALLKRYDIVLYKRECDKYVLHRIVNIRGDLYDMCGDNQLEVEKGIPKENIIAYVPAIYKGENRIDTDSQEYLKEIKKLYDKKKRQRIVASVKGFLYPAYKLIFKK